MVMNRSGIATGNRFDSFLLAAMVAGCAPGAQVIEPEVLADYIAEGKAGTVFAPVGLRDAESFRRAHLPGARNISYDALDDDEALFRDGRPVIFHDEGEPDAAPIANALGGRLPDHIVVLAGGLVAWRAAGRPIAEGTS